MPEPEYVTAVREFAEHYAGWQDYLEIYKDLLLTCNDAAELARRREWTAWANSEATYRQWAEGKELFDRLYPGVNSLDPVPPGA